MCKNRCNCNIKYRKREPWGRWFLKNINIFLLGSNSLDYHSKTFSICGAMNNLILVVVPFTGDMSQIISQEITKVFKVMDGSDCTQVLNVCFLEYIFTYFKQGMRETITAPQTILKLSTVLLKLLAYFL